MGAVREAIYCRIRVGLLLGLFFAPVAALAWRVEVLRSDMSFHIDPPPNSAWADYVANETPDADDTTVTVGVGTADADPAPSPDPTCPD